MCDSLPKDHPKYQENQIKKYKQFWSIYKPNEPIPDDVSVLKFFYDSTLSG